MKNTILLPLSPLISLSHSLLVLSRNLLPATTGVSSPQPDPISPQQSTPDCATASLHTSFGLTFISYGNYTALPGQDGGEAVLVPPQVMSMSFAVVNAANGVHTTCAFPLGHLSGAEGGEYIWVDDASWQTCADRRDDDGKHRFTIATGAAFSRAEGLLRLNQTWFCHDDAGRLVAYTGIANGSLSMSCADGGELGGYHVENCTAPDGTFPVTLL
ncbi:hypothetical protein K445DRAFT_17566 [Daldinia sp. EC12]|nr:hypothetical protein K445DRAFT_17566 [Daldinia sp. EC12]